MSRIKVNQKTFEGQSVYIGIDYHKKNWKITILGEHSIHKTMNSDPNAEKLANYLKTKFPGADYHAVYEAGFSGFSSCRKLIDLGVDCKVIHAADVPTNQKERLQKTDKADSNKLARALRNGEFKGVHLPDLQLEIDRGLIRQRYRVMKDVTRIKGRVKSLLFQFGIKIPDRFTSSQTRYWSKVYLNWLKNLDDQPGGIIQLLNNYIRSWEVLRNEQLLINGQIRKLSQTCRYRENYRLLISVPGIGTIAAMTLLTELGDIKRFPHFDSLSSYVGLVPGMHGSGDRMVVSKMINRGRKAMKIILIEAAWVAIRKDPAMMATFNGLSGRMAKNKAIVRIARKLLNRIRFILTYQQEYELGVLK